MDRFVEGIAFKVIAFVLFLYNLNKTYKSMNHLEDMILNLSSITKNPIFTGISELFNMNNLDVFVFTLVSYLFFLIYKLFKNTYESLKNKATSEQEIFLQKYNDLLIYIEKINDSGNTWTSEDYKELKYLVKGNQKSIEYSVYKSIIGILSTKEPQINKIKIELEQRVENLYFKTNFLKDYSKSNNYINIVLNSISNLILPIAASFSLLLVASITFIIIYAQPSSMERMLTLIMIIIGLSVLSFLFSPLKERKNILIFAIMILIINAFLIFFDGKWFYVLYGAYVFLMIVFFRLIYNDTAKNERNS